MTVDALSGEVVETRVRFRCERPSKWAGFVLADGTYVPARCGAPNKCAYCAWLVAVENTAVVALDSIAHGHPTVGMTLTTVDPHHDLGRFRRDVERTIAAVRRRAPDVEYLGMMEWTTGRGARSGGRRRVHQHLLLRGVAAEECDDLERVVRKVWQARTGASRVELRELRSAAGATAYVVAHHHKTEQAPPPGFKGRRLRHSKGYFEDGIAELRGRVKAIEAANRLQRSARRLVDWDYLDGAPDEVVDAELRAAVAEAEAEQSGVVFVKLDRQGAYRLDTVRPVRRAA